MSKYTTVHGIHIAQSFEPETFGRLTTIGPKFIIHPLSGKKCKSILQVYECSCGNVTVCHVSNVYAGRTKSCGCLNDTSRVESNTKHGHTARGEKWSLTYHSYVSMKSRCYNKKNNRYYAYGARGITVCARWLEPDGRGFLNFLSDMGTRTESKYTIERRLPDIGYCPENCRWATTIEQARNKRNNVFLTFDNRTQCVSAWAEEVGIKQHTISARLRSGWSTEDALTTPVNKKTGQTNGRQ